MGEHMISRPCFLVAIYLAFVTATGLSQTWPIGTADDLSSAFGPRNLGTAEYPNSGYDYDFHRGTDIGRTGDVVAVLSGIVVRVLTDIDGVIIEDLDGSHIRYSHMSHELSVNDPVIEGQLIGQITAPEDHLDVKYYYTFTDLEDLDQLDAADHPMWVLPYADANTNFSILDPRLNVDSDGAYIELYARVDDNELDLNSVDLFLTGTTRNGAELDETLLLRGSDLPTNVVDYVSRINIGDRQVDDDDVGFNNWIRILPRRFSKSDPYHTVYFRFYLDPFWYGELQDGTFSGFAVARDANFNERTSHTISFPTCIDCNSPPGSPPAPTGLVATSSTATMTVDLQWSPSPPQYNTKQYAIYRRPLGTVLADAQVIGVSSDTDFSDDSQTTPSQSYYYSVAAINQIGEGQNSAEVLKSMPSSGTVTTSRIWKGSGKLTGGVTIRSGATLTVESGSTVAFGSGVSMTVQSGAKLVAVGTSSAPIKFTSSLTNPGRRSYGTFFIYSSNNQFKYCTIEYSDWGLLFYGPASGNVVKNCTLRQNDQAIRIHYNQVEVRNCVLENNRHAFVFLDNTLQYGGIYLDGNTVRNNDREGINSTNSVVQVYRSVFDNNGSSGPSHGIYATYYSDIALGSRSWGGSVSTTGGYNTVKNSRGAGVFVNGNSLVLLGDRLNYTYRAGNNSIHGNGKASGTYSGKNLYNLTSATVKAIKNYWGSTPGAGMFYGPINCTEWLSSAPSGTSAPALTGIDEAAGSDGELNARGEPDGIADLPFGVVLFDSVANDRQIKRGLIRQLKEEIAQHPESPAAASALETIYSFVRTDWNDDLGERSGCYRYLRTLYEANRQAELGRRALQLMILERMGRENFDEAIAVAQAALANFPHSTRHGTMGQLIRLLLRTGDIAQARQLFETFKDEYPDEQNARELLQSMFRDAEHNLAHAASSNLSSPSAEAFRDTLQLSQNQIPLTFNIYPNFPNPFNPTTELRYVLPHPSRVTLRIFNVLGEEVRTLIDMDQPSGDHAAVWDGKNTAGHDVAAGVYMYRITALPSGAPTRGVARSGKMSLLR